MNPYTIAGFVSSALLVVFGIYILKADPKRSINRMFAIIAFLLAVWCFGKSMGDLGSENIAFLWKRFGEAGLILMWPVTVHLTCIYPRPRLSRVHIALLYLPAAFFMGFLFVELFTMEEILSVFPTSVPYFTYQLIFACFAMFNVAMMYVKSRYPMERTQLKSVLVGVVVLVPIVLSTICLNLFFGYVGRPAVFAIPVGFGVIAYAMMKYKLFVLPPICRFFIPVPEARLRTKLKYRLEKGESYLIKERKPKRGPKIFTDLTRHGIPGLWLTTSPPERVRKKYGLARSPILCLASERVRGEATIPPDKLDKALGAISTYFLRVPRRSVVIVDCFRDIIKVNGFDRAMSFLEKLRKICSENRSNLIVQVNPDEFTKKQLVVIEKVITRS